MRPGNGGNLGDIGNVESVICRPHYPGDGTKPPSRLSFELLYKMCSHHANIFACFSCSHNANIYTDARDLATATERVLGRASYRGTAAPELVFDHEQSDLENICGRQEEL
jgi:hypothetical protein